MMSAILPLCSPPFALVSWKVLAIVLSLHLRCIGGYDVYPDTRVLDSVQDNPVCAVTVEWATGYNTIELERTLEGKKKS